ncbi:PREDICTED: ryncolin-4-like [Amphimedon queenslandica]|uniref:Fibrinogen C-terminal domain-containing protein n=1 Tax=Amphimedon queenslandica TaxID=400682 RepID=A0A1X7VF69_AMPQE|nr:PREDICTED: ryncolin-4-like [Amphimedon queenslandica]|eukprot:XP_011410509.1 PREDICTED: ryncolin-4-like [Amphimedon queenslandica]
MLALIVVKTPLLFLSLLISFSVYTSGKEHSLPNNKDFCLAAVDLQQKARPNETAVQDCCDAFLLGGRTGVYWYRSVGRTHRVFCDMTTAGGGWLVILRRLKEWPVHAGNPDYFERYYNPEDEQGDYQRGFGSLDQNFWFGLNKLYRLTNRSNVYAQARFEFTEYETGIEYWVEYDTFAVGPKTSDYTLTIGNYTDGNLPDIFSVLNGWTFKPGNICRHNSSWWYPKLDRRKYWLCRCLTPFVTNEGSAVSRFEDACLEPRHDHLMPSLPPSHYEIIIDTMEIKIRFKRYPCSHHVHSTT